MVCPWNSFPSSPGTPGLFNWDGNPETSLGFGSQRKSCFCPHAFSWASRLTASMLILSPGCLCCHESLPYKPHRSRGHHGAWMPLTLQADNHDLDFASRVRHSAEKKRGSRLPPKAPSSPPASAWEVCGLMPTRVGTQTTYKAPHTAPPPPHPHC